MFRVGSIGLAGLVTIGSVSSYFGYSTAGFDFEVATPAGVEVTYYRLRWDDGSTWAGWAVQPVGRKPGRALDWFDPGGTWWARPVRPAHRGLANDLGFWWVDGVAADPYVGPRYAGATASRWAAAPSWLVAGLAWAGAIGGGRVVRAIGRRISRGPGDRPA